MLQAADEGERVEESWGVKSLKSAERRPKSLKSKTHINKYIGYNYIRYLHSIRYIYIYYHL